MKFIPVEEMTVIPGKKPVLKKIRNVLLWIFFGALGIIVALLSLLFIYEDEVKAAMVTELNRHLKAEVKIDPKNIDLTIIKTFPDCSIQFKDLLMLEALQLKNRDTLLYAGRLNLHFNISDLWHKKYEVEKIKIKDAVIKLRILKNGANNYIFWEEEPATPGEKDEGINFNLKLVALENCRLAYTNQQTLLKTSLAVKTLAFSGNFNQSQFDLRSDAKIMIGQLAHENTVYLKDKALDFDIAMKVAGNNYTFTKTRISLNQLALQLDGGFIFKDSLQSLDVAYKAPSLDIASALSLLPASFKTKINDYESRGNFYAQGSLHYTGSNAYNISSDFGIRNGTITYKPQSTTASNINVEGSLKLSDKSSVLDLRNIYIRLNNDELKGSCFIRDFSDPYIKLSSSASLHLENLQAFFPIDTLTTLKGQLKISADAEGSVRDLKNETFSKRVKLNLDAVVTNIEAQFKGDERLYTIESCAITAREREIEVKDLVLKRGSSDIRLNGKIPGVFNYLLDRKEPLVITGNLASNYIKLEDFMPKASGQQQANENPLIPGNIQFKLDAAIARFTFAKFEANTVAGDIEIKNQKAIVSHMTLETMQGNAEINAFADNSKNKLEVVLQSNLKNINIQQLFTQFNNFGQATMQDRNIKGYASANIDFSGTWNNKLEADYNTIRANCDLLIERGELIDFKPLNSLARFVDIKDLQRIKFSALQSNISIDNSMITFPRTHIKNSALNLEFWGTHSFNNQIDYHIQLLISELLAKKLKNSDEEFGPVEHDKDNKRSAFILMTGTVDDPKIKYDRRGLKEKIRKDIKEEKQNIRQVLKEELGLFKKDAEKEKNKKAEQTFELEKPNNNPPKKTLELKKKEEDDF